MDRVIALVPARQQAASDLAYWLSRPMAERIAAVEFLRQQAEPDAGTGTGTDHAQQRLQRVCRVTQRPAR